MIIYPYTTFFNQLNPNLSPGEKKLRYDHPSGLIWCNQLGMLFPTNEDNWIQVQNKGTIFLVTEEGYNRFYIKERVVYQCYHGMTDNNQSVHHKNGNLQDFTKDNLVIYRSKSNESRAHNTMMHDIEQATIRYMYEKSLELYRKNLDPEYYWELIQPGETLVKKWRVYFQRHLSLYLPDEQGKSIPY
jgi:hypothetical protein